MIRSFAIALVIYLAIWTPSNHADDLSEDKLTDDSSVVDYGRDVAPILVDNCLACHGLDEGTRQGGLRLDLREGALMGGDSGRPAIVPGKPDESEIVTRINATGEEVMPPASHAERLRPHQIELIKKWISQGASVSEHWAFVSPHKRALPDNGAKHPIDAFVKQRLDRAGLKPSARESNNILCRRIYLDLIGLPPSPEDLADFDRDGLEATVNRLLSSKRFGEKWSQPWLDAARYSDTNGYEKDLRRDQWAWRDWVIESFNNDMPYDQFVIEQIAGDLLPNATQNQIIATGFLRNSMINEEGAIVPEQFRMVEMFDRMDCIGKSILGLSTQCAQCHSHKFDPLTQEEYFGMFAFLNNTYEAQSWVYSSDQEAKRKEILASISQREEQIRKEHATWQEDLNAWVASITATQATWEPVVFDDLNSVSGLNHPTQERDLSILMKGHTSVDVYMIGSPEMNGVTGLRLEVLNHADLPFRGPGRSETGTWGLRELEAFIRKPEATDWEKLKLVDATADFSEPEQKTDGDKNISGPVALAIDGHDNTWWKADRGMGLRNVPSVAVMAFETPLALPAGTRFKIAMRMTDMIGSCRISLTKSNQPKADPIDYDAILAMQAEPLQRTPDQEKALFTAWRKTRPEWQSINDQISELWKQWPAAKTSVLHMAEREPSNHRETHLLSRGEWDKPQQVVAPTTPKAFHPMPECDEPLRLRFARWLVDKRSPLAARVAVNRVWQSLFGVGLVETSEDFGTRTPLPEYGNLLDWLAVDFMEKGWSHKELIRTIVLSETYCQTSKITPQLVELDPTNRLLARGPRFRADAEVIRDIALTISGLIHHQIGGPSVIPPVPQNVLDYNYVYPAYWTPAQGPERYRRTVYSFRKRSMPDPAMSTLDAPNGDFACARRTRSNTPLAALTTLNEPIFVESAQALALRILREGGDSDSSRIDRAYLLCMNRLPSDGERNVVLELLASHRKRIADGWLNAREVTTGKADQLPPLPASTTPQDAAAWTLTARVLLNLDETISKN